MAEVNFFKFEDMRQNIPVMLNKAHVIKIEYTKTEGGMPVLGFHMIDGSSYFLEAAPAEQKARELGLINRDTTGVRFGSEG